MTFAARTIVSKVKVVFNVIKGTGMKTLVVYFSRSGHTRELATEIAARCAADLEAIRETKCRDGFLGYWRSVWDAVKRATPPIHSALHDPARYDLVIIGTPVWNFGLAPPVRAYAQQHAAQFKRVAFFCTEGGSGDQRAFAELRKICRREPVATFALTEKQLPAPAHRERLQSFVARVAVG